MLYRAKAPLRLSFAGGGTDVPPFPEQEGGLVLSATVNRYVYGTLRPRDDQRIRIRSVDLGLDVDYSADSLVFDGKLDLVKPAIQKLGGSNLAGFDLFLRSSVAPGSGLGSSSTVMVALIGLLREFRQLPLTDYEIAETAYLLEREDLGIKGGLQDQYAATFGGFNFIEFHHDHVIVNPLRISRDVVDELEHNMLLCYTGTARASDRIIDDQTARYRRHEDSTLEGLRMQKELAIQMKNALLQRKLTRFGELLGEAWSYKKQMSPKISNAFIEEAYSEAIRSGAIGGKVTGAGGGGHMVFYCRFDRKHEVAERLTSLGATVTDFAFEPRGLGTWTFSDD
jgi:D-glycero-alpha-D-manno-heptose-7-phosphate kinase